MSRKRNGLSPQDIELWHRVAATAIPMHKRPVVRHPDVKPKPAVGRAPLMLTEDFILGPADAIPRTRVALQPAIEEAVAAHPLRMDHGAFRKMKRGKSEPEARIDLHGMTLAEAHPALIGFVLRAQGAGSRLVLVITGKGRRVQDDGPIPQRIGALRHQVPHWLHSPPLGSVVQQIAPAHQRHGGAGAYYVYLRRSR
jgi:DNA-nicking Smr family endonuclease